MQIADDELEPFMTIPEVARVLRCSERSVRRYIAEGKIAAERFARRWLIPRWFVRTIAGGGVPA